MLFISNAYAAKKEKCPYKWGKVSKEKLQMKVYDKDSSTSAVIMADIGRVEIISPYKLKFYRFKRIKVLNKDGFNFAKFKIVLSKLYNNKEEIHSLKAVTYNIENGKVVKSKFKNKNIIRESESENKRIIKINMPDVKEGSIVDIKYTVRSPFISNLPVWFFQNTIPTEWSELNVEIPEYFKYSPVFYGYLKMTKTEKSNHIHHHMKCNTETTRLIMKDAPAMEPQCHTTSVHNFMSHIRYKLKRVNIPGPNVTYNDIDNTWGKIAGDLSVSRYFGEKIDNSDFLSKIIDTLIVSKSTESVSIQKIFNYVKTNVKWNEKLSFGAYSVDKNLKWNGESADEVYSFKNNLKKKSGDSGDINLLLVSMLKKAGIEAYPVLLSTRNNGMIHQFQPSLYQFNYVVAAIKQGEKYIFADATEPFNKIGYLPFRCLNDNTGFIIGDGNEKWMQKPQYKLIKYGWVTFPEKIFAERNFTTININKDLKVTGNYQCNKIGYADINFKNSKNQKGEIINKNTLTEKYPDLAVSRVEVKNVENNTASTSYSFDFESISNFNNSDSTFEINPYLFSCVTNNPFKIEERKYPVDFGYKSSIMNVTTINLPDNIEVESLPKSNIYKLSDKGSMFSSMIKSDNKTITITTRFILKDKTIMPENYEYLRMFYKSILENNKQKIVLRKI